MPEWIHSLQKHFARSGPLHLFYCRRENRVLLKCPLGDGIGACPVKVDCLDERLLGDMIKCRDEDKADRRAPGS